jgi:hypothetical protein
MSLNQVFAPRLPGVGPYMAGRFALGSLFLHNLSLVSILSPLHRIYFPWNDFLL